MAASGFADESFLQSLIVVESTKDLMAKLLLNN